jgi:hypothetical protein
MTTLEFFRSRGFLKAIMVVFALAILSAAFAAGVMVGFHKAQFSYQWGESYHRNFGGPSAGFVRGMQGMQGDEFVGAYGVYGRITAINGNQLMIIGKGPEQIVELSDKTEVRRFRDAVPASELKVGDVIVVVGNPVEQGHISADLIRIMPAPMMPGYTITPPPAN